MADDDNLDVGIDQDDYTPLDPTTPAEGHGYDAFFFIVAIIVAIGFVVVLYYFKG